MPGRWRQLPRQERRDLWPAAWRLLVARLCLLAGIARSQRWLGGNSELDIPDQIREGSLAGNRDERVSAQDEIWQRRALALKRIGSRMPDTHCLARALALRWWMRTNHLPAQMKIGVRKGPHGLESHAWVELNGCPVDESRETTATYSVIGA